MLIDTTNVIATDSQIKGKIRVRPHGYGRFIEFSIGFNIQQHKNMVMNSRQYEWAREDLMPILGGRDVTGIAR